jgi:hypothetical protein
MAEELELPTVPISPAAVKAVVDAMNDVVDAHGDTEPSSPYRSSEPVPVLEVPINPGLHGALIDEHRRWCAACNQEHDSLHACPHLPPAIRDSIALRTKQLDAMRADPEMAMSKGGLRHAELCLLRLWAGKYG